MGATMTDRGPDGSGVWYSGPVALTLRRLKIIDLSDRGAQPMVEPQHPIAELRRIYEVFKVQMLPFVEALLTRKNPEGDLGEEIRGSLIPADDLPRADGKAPEEDLPPPQDLHTTPRGR